MRGEIRTNQSQHGGIEVQLRVRIEERDLRDGQLPPAVVEALTLVLDQPYEFHAKLAALVALIGTMRTMEQEFFDNAALPPDHPRRLR